jgi:CelD/BcsL family acetyltransferase involved in cellulose biosynthesis
MRLDGRVIAFQIYLRYGRMVSEIRHDFDVAFGSYSPGKVLQMAVIRDLYGRDGVWEYDMGGNAYGYKLRWTSLIRPHIDLWAAGNGWYGRALMFGKRRVLPLLSGRRESAASPTPERGD